MEDLSPPARLRQLLRWMCVDEDRVGNLDLAWLAENLDRWSKHPHYPEARRLIVSLLEPGRNGRSKRLR